MNRVFDWFSRFLMTMFWILVLLVLLFSPKIFNVFSSKKRSINVYCWVDAIDFKSVKEFEKQSGIKVNLSFYEQNYELFSKLQITNGKGYDLVMVTDFAVDFLVKKDLLKELDKSRMNFFNDLESYLLNKPFDPQNKYSIPYLWDIYVIGYKKDSFKNGQVPIESFDLLFNPKYMPKHIAMVEEANEAITTAVEYKFGDDFEFDNKNSWKEIRKVLLQQKSNVEAYSDLRSGEFLVSGAADIAYGQSAYMCRAKQRSSDISLFIPKPRSFVAIDSFIVMKASQKDDLIYKFLNFIYNKDIQKKIASKYFYLSSRSDSLQEQDLSCLGGKDNVVDALKKAKLFSTSVNIQKAYRLWMQVKAY